MDENVNDQDVLLVKSKDNPKVEVVTGTDDKGSLKTTAPKKENEPDFLKIDKHGNVLATSSSTCPGSTKTPPISSSSKLR